MRTGHPLLALVLAAFLGAPALAASPFESPAAAGTARDLVAQRLEAIGRDREAASESAARLTLEDLLVLSRHPEMLQAAGGRGDDTWNLTVGLLVLGGLFAVAAAGNGSIMIN